MLAVADSCISHHMCDVHPCIAENESLPMLCTYHIKQRPSCKSVICVRMAYVTLTVACGLSSDALGLMQSYVLL